METNLHHTKNDSASPFYKTAVHPDNSLIFKNRLWRSCGGEGRVTPCVPKPFGAQAQRTNIENTCALCGFVVAFVTCIL